MMSTTYLSCSLELIMRGHALFVLTNYVTAPLLYISELGKVLVFKILDIHNIDPVLMKRWALGHHFPFTSYLKWMCTKRWHFSLSKVTVARWLQTNESFLSSQLAVCSKLTGHHGEQLGHQQSIIRLPVSHQSIHLTKCLLRMITPASLNPTQYAVWVENATNQQQSVSVCWLIVAGKFVCQML